MVFITQIVDFFIWLFSSILSGFTIFGLKPFYFFVACIVASSILSVVFHNKG